MRHCLRVHRFGSRCSGTRRTNHPGGVNLLWSMQLRFKARWITDLLRRDDGEAASGDLLDRNQDASLGVQSRKPRSA